MLTFFSDPYPDELLFGVFSRYHLRSGNDSLKRTQRELSGCNSGIAIGDFPCRIGKLIERLPLGANYTASGLIDQCTILPFYKPFLPSDRVRLIVKDMAGSKGGGLHMRIGDMASSVNFEPGLRFCPGCIRTDEEKFGEPYWHRIHQIPGVHVCIEHHLYLETRCTICGFLQSRNSRQEFVALETHCQNGHDLVYPQCGRMVNLERDLDSKLLNFANEIRTLLELKPNFGEPEQLAARYVSILQQRGLATPLGRIRQIELYEEFLGFHGEEFLRALESFDVKGNQTGWLANIFRKQRKAFHPIRHLLVMQFLAGSVEKFAKTNKQKYLPFGKGPWPCLNSAAEHYKELVIQACRVTLCTDTSLPVGTFTCACGFVYSRRGPDKCPQDRYKIGRIKCFGTIWETELTKVVSEGTSGLREIARRMNVDPNTVKKYAKKLGLELPTCISPVTSKEHEKTQENVVLLQELLFKRRQELLWTMSGEKSFTRTEIRQKIPGTYIWLYRNDREWLESVLPSPVEMGQRNSGRGNTKVNWEARDKELSAEVKRAAEELYLADGKPLRVTVGKIGSKIGVLGLLEKHLDKLPLTKVILEKVTETHEDFQIRKIHWAVEFLKETDQGFEEWRVVKTAGLRPSFSERVRREIALEIERVKNFGWNLVESGVILNETDYNL